MTKNQIAELWPSPDVKLLDGQTCYCRGSLLSSFAFINGRLVFCRLDGVKDVEMGAAASGEFISLPAAKSDVKRVFGRPKRFATVRGNRT